MCPIYRIFFGHLELNICVFSCLGPKLAMRGKIRTTYPCTGTVKFSKLDAFYCNRLTVTRCSKYAFKPHCNGLGTDAPLSLPLFPTMIVPCHQNPHRVIERQPLHSESLISSFPPITTVMHLGKQRRRSRVQSSESVLDHLVP